MSDGETRQAALANAEVIIQEWIDTARELGRQIPPPQGNLITIPEAAEQLGLSVAMVRRYCSTGKLHAHKVGRDWTIQQKDVEQFATLVRRRGRKQADFK
jgi:excisionase family DNA binding protein